VVAVASVVIAAMTTGVEVSRGGGCGPCVGTCGGCGGVPMPLLDRTGGYEVGLRAVSSLFRQRYCGSEGECATAMDGSVRVASC
jgi:hypothetical protein